MFACFGKVSLCGKLDVCLLLPGTTIFSERDFVDVFKIEDLRPSVLANGSYPKNTLVL